MTLRLNAQRYERARALNPIHRGNLVLGSIEDLRWLKAKPGFLYRTQSAHGPVTKLVDLESREIRDVPDEEVNAHILDLDPRRRNASDDELPYQLLTHGWNLYLHNRKSGQRSQLTDDGELERAWGAARNPRSAAGDFVPATAIWSPDGSRAVTQRMDYRGVRTYPLVEAAPSGGGPPVAHIEYDPWPGDQHVPVAELAIVNAESGSIVPVAIQPLPSTHTSPMLRNEVWWGDSRDSLFVLFNSRDWLTLTIYQVETRTGTATPLVTEVGERRLRPAQEFHQAPAVRVLESTNEVIWFSERDGWGHLYLYDGISGTCKSRITQGEFVVQQILHLDQSTRTVVLLVSGLIETDPYRWTIVRVSIDSGEL